jgi:hypothetical protein
LKRVAGALEAHAAEQLPRGDRAILWFEWKERIFHAAPAPEGETAAIEPETRQEYLYARVKDEESQTQPDLKKAA